MEKNIRDYIPFYLGCEVFHKELDLKATLMKYDLCEGLCWIDIGIAGPEYIQCGMEDIKPLLRPLDTMTEDEKMELIRVEHSEKDYPIISCIKLDETTLWFSARDKRMRHSMSFSVGFTGWMPNEFKYLLSNHFDIFNLIPEGLALDATKQEVNHG